MTYEIWGSVNGNPPIEDREWGDTKCWTDAVDDSGCSNGRENPDHGSWMELRNGNVQTRGVRLQAMHDP